MMNSIDTSVTHITTKNGNVFKDLGFPPEEASKLKIKAQLMCQISEWIKEKQLKQEETSNLLHVTRPRISDIMRGKSGKFSIDALVDMLERAGKHVTVEVG
ncbi:MAG: XRE family transcriptional regulator [Methylococcales symbiont of Hymedesmia sp. n. MRB-2018]|nr:MAG: XRE family transcriptional regulator [Methylococcales symbiont of Hymedesmia sp. n. MRB-2018]